MTPRHDGTTTRRPGHTGRVGDDGLPPSPAISAAHAMIARRLRAARELSRLDDARLAELGLTRRDIARTIESVNGDAARLDARRDR